EMMFAVFGFLFYFFDVAWVLQDDFALLVDLQVVGVFAIVRSLVSVVTGGGCLMAFWLLLCDYLGGTNRALRVVPGVVYVLGSIAALTLLPDGIVQRFV
ncbi:helix-turn-helix transcriptional regulator, partial [Eggerthella lenta]|nr:helix-turn-helix transcriptional regulator [Eggerthella lenta]